MISKLLWSKTRIFWAIKKGAFFSFLKDFEWRIWTASWKKEAKRQKLFKSKFIIRTFLENGFEATLSSKTNVMSIRKGHFSFFVHFWMKKLKAYSAKARQSLQNHLNSTLVIESFLENSFQRTLRSKMNVLGIWKGKFSVFYNFWVTKLKPIQSKTISTEIWL